jgi:hypothetical protein
MCAKKAPDDRGFFGAIIVKLCKEFDVKLSNHLDVSELDC